MSGPQLKITPMYSQYLSIKKDYPDALLFYRMGDFYELFFDDAETASRELQLTLTSRSRDEGGVPMCGVPWHACEGYISQLVEKGYRIAICDQIEDPRQAKGLVKRAVTRVITAGTVIEDSNLEAKAHTYLGALFWNDAKGAGAFAWMDVSTGAWTGLQSGQAAELRQWILKMLPSELIIPDTPIGTESLNNLPEVSLSRVPYRSHFEPRRAAERLFAAQGVQDASALGLEKSPELIQACGAIIAYLEQIQKRDPSQLSPFKPIEKSSWLIVDEVTEKNLELFKRLDGKKGQGTLWNVMDHTRTPMGGRMLEDRMRCPWRHLRKIMSVQDAAAWMLEKGDELEGVREALDGVYDIERLSTRISLDRCQPRDMAALRESLLSLPAVHDTLFGTSEENRELPSALRDVRASWDMLDDVAGLLHRALRDELPLQITEGGLFREGYDAELDELIGLQEHGEGMLQELLSKEQSSNALPKLKLGYNRVIGYYFELSRAQLGSGVPEYFIRKQNLSNCDRFTTPELRELEERIQSASEKRKSMEYRLFQDLRKRVASERARLVFMADIVANIDFWQSLGYAARKNAWTRPVLEESERLEIRQGRHPVVEAITGRASFIPNDLVMNSERHLLLITGPNMAGKSTVLRQTAIITLMAQMGSFVPAEKAVIGLVDRIFSRVGASDNLAQGQSTFMVEMMETARILRQAGKKSLVILDEIGRGTSTFDGLSLAWAVVEDLASRSGGTIRTLFATHYHELTSLAGTLTGVCNMNIAVREWNGDIIFLRRLIPGPADRSYGIEVAKLAGVPASVVQRARQILDRLEKNGSGERQAKIAPATLPGLSLPPAKPRAGAERKEHVPAPHPLEAALADIDPDTLTPLQALKILTDWKLLWGKNNVSAARNDTACSTDATEEGNS